MPASIRAFFWRLMNFIRRAKPGISLSEDREFHQQMQVEANLHEGMSPEKARRHALISLGGVERTRDADREALGIRWFNELRQDLRFGMRMLAKSPGFTAVAMLVFALGIGVNTAIFSIVNAALFRPLPVHSPGELVSVYGIHGKGARPSFIPYPDYLDIRGQKDVFAGMLAFTVFMEPVSAGNRTEVTIGEQVSGNYFDVLGIKPAVGRAFLSAEVDKPGAQPVVVISQNFWKRRLNSDPDALGKSIKIRGHSFTIVGIAPAEFKGLWLPELASAQVWVPIVNMASLDEKGSFLADRNRDSVLAIGRLTPGVTLREAQAAVETKARQLEQSYPATNKDHSFRLLATNSVRVAPEPSADVVPRLLSAALMTVSGTVLLIACANIAGLLMARGITRRKEIAVRLAVGAGRFRLIRQLLAESALLALAGGILGLFLARLLVNLAISTAPNQIEFVELSLDIPIDMRVLLFTVLVCIGTGVLVGLMPAVRVTKTHLVSALAAEGIVSAHRERHRLRHWILVPQICFSLVLLIIAGLFVKTVLQAEWIDPGFNVKSSAVLSVDLQWNKYTEEQGRAFYRRLLESAQALPGVTAASLVDALPTSFPNGPHRNWFLTEQEQAVGKKVGRYAYCELISPDYFRTMVIPILHGRDFNLRDGSSAPRVAIVSEEAARRFWPGQDPIGKRLAFENRKGRLVEVVGVVKDVRGALDRTQNPFIYLPFEQQYAAGMQLVARSAGNPAPLAERLRTLAYEVDQNVAAVESKTVAENVGLSIYLLRTAAAVLAVCGGFGLLLATVGLYGVVSYSVAQRTREIGLRAALGARSADIIRMVIGEGLKVSMVGTVFGILLALAAKKYIMRFSLGLVTFDAAAFVGIPLLLGAVVLLACYLPARRAARVDPLTALREL
jgi:predicted permease